MALGMKSKREFATAQVAVLHSARSQEKHEYDIDKQEDYNHGKNDYSLHIQGHGAMQNTVVFQFPRFPTLLSSLGSRLPGTLSSPSSLVFSLSSPHPHHIP
ncbi:hypothetical protein GW7_13936 [Heterocephalus glaber]|uniref:Uncharacterized protein n=1 Tax=Heterocephalus glaber TaxID=10181 RepID=G5BHS1_HETGA|nr:hypothetical protein GW7_13936 [Heterocephalus glaber]